MGSEKKPISNSPSLKWEVKRSPSPTLPAGERDVDGGDDAYLKLKGGKRENIAPLRLSTKRKTAMLMM